VKPWHGLPREAVEAPTLETPEARLEGALSSLVRLELSRLPAGLGPDGP